MPIMRKDKESGAIIFDLTPEEKSTKEQQQEVNQLKEELERKVREADELIQALKAQK